MVDNQELGLELDDDEEAVWTPTVLAGGAATVDGTSISDSWEIDPYEEEPYQVDEADDEDDGFMPKAFGEVCVAVRELLR